MLIYDIYHTFISKKNDSTQNFTVWGNTAVLTFNSINAASCGKGKVCKTKRGLLKSLLILSAISNSLINQSTIHFVFNLGTMSK